MNEVVIRKAKKDDLEEIVVLAKQLWDTEKPFDLNLEDNYYETEEGRDGLLKDIRSRKRFFLVALIDSKVVGFVDGYIIENDGIYRQEVAYLSRISVLKDYRGMGIGSKLIDEFSSLAQEKECSFVKLCVFMDNIPAVSLYNERGFKEYSVYYQKKI